MLPDVSQGADTLVAVDEIMARSTVPAGVHLTVIGVDFTVPSLEPRRAGTCVSGHAGGTGSSIVAGIG